MKKPHVPICTKVSGGPLATTGKTIFDEEGRVPSPFRTAFVNATDREAAEAIFRREYGSQWQIDEVKVNMFCAMIIYHHHTDPTR